MTDEFERQEQIEVVNVETWDDLRDDVTFVIEIPRPGDRVQRVKVREMSYGDWLQVELDHPLPDAPMYYSKGAIKQYDRDDPIYRRSASEVREKWMYLRILKALVVDVPGDTLEEKINEIKTHLGASAIQTLYMQLMQLHGIKQGEVKRLSESFQPVPVDGAEDM